VTVSFDPREHAYRAGGRKVPSVTEILRAEGLTSSYAFSDRTHAFRGSAVHRACAMLDFGANPIVSGPKHLQQVVDDINNGYVPAFARWRERTKFQGRCWECPIVSPEMGYGGTFDAAGNFEGSPEIVLLDLKSGVMPAMVPIQLAGYLDLIQKGTPVDAQHYGWEWLQENVRSGVPVRRVAVRLEKTGRETMFTEGPDGTHYSHPMWTVAFRSAVNLHNLKAKFNLKEEGGKMNGEAR